MFHIGEHHFKIQYIHRSTRTTRDTFHLISKDRTCICITFFSIKRNIDLDLSWRDSVKRLSTFQIRRVKIAFLLNASAEKGGKTRLIVGVKIRDHRFQVSDDSGSYESVDRFADQISLIAFPWRRGRFPHHLSRPLKT